jgi:hypothetical protein
MDATGAEKLRTRLEYQEHWQKAEAVVRGDQPRVDPDADDLEEIGDGVRLYGIREEHRQVVDGAPSLVVQRMTKRLVDGWWQTVYEIERVQQLIV